ncbi:C40 family peptidase [Haloprofundus marisrubri]|uniref:C40 family peptidase n=1 Tax=Haloprofundus marisrubri TaxID=1514971 RepID=UPI0009E27076|nr:C40 family peptidase [Haloprofundus marisrubri]
MSIISRFQATVDSCCAIHAPDDRTTVFDLNVETDDQLNEITLLGTVQTKQLLENTATALREATGWTVTTTSVTVLEAESSVRTVDKTAVAVRDSPAESSEQVTQVLYGATIQAYDSTDTWTRIRTPDGYIGWIQTDTLSDTTSLAGPAVTNQAIETDLSIGFIPAGVECELIAEDGDFSRVRFRTDETATVSSHAISTQDGQNDPEAVVDCALEFLETVYEWGGMTNSGIDCSGLAWIAYRTLGVRLPRDADQQRYVGTEVSRDELQPGDLLFFPGHVAISLGRDEYIHAYGGSDSVVTNSLNPDADAYIESLDDSFETARRVISQ